MELINDYQSEMCFIGALYKEPDLFIEYSHLIKSKYDFSKDETVFFYDNFCLMYKTFSQEFTKVSITVFMKQDNARFIQFEKFGGYNAIKVMVNLSNINDVKNYYNLIKKYAILRDFQKITIESIVSTKKFYEMDAQNLGRFIRAKVDHMQTVILTNNDSHILNKGMEETVIEFLKKPDRGIDIPFKEMNKQFNGHRLGTMLCVGMLSNAGKTRFMFDLIADIAFIKKQKVFVLLNEMTELDVKKCLLTTVVNNKSFQEKHGVVLKKNEKDISLGKYFDETKKEIPYTKDLEKYIEILMEKSPDFQKVIQISRWIDQETENLIFIKDVSDGYDDKTLEFEIRKANATQGIQYFFYDTLKNDLDTIGEWGALKTTTTKLQQLAKNLNIFVYGSIQLTDDSLTIPAFLLSSMNIANCKSIKHVLDGLLLAKEIELDDYHKYTYTNGEKGWGTQGDDELVKHNLDPKKRYYIFVTDKNRVGEKKKLLFSLDLNTNVWIEEGIADYIHNKKAPR
jgi:replicative DNA helicase